MPGGEALTEEMNVFLRSKKVLQVESHLVSNAQGAFWCFCIKYLDDTILADRDKIKVDYKQVLDEVTFKRFSRLREIRKKVAQDEAIPAFAIFTDEELASLAKIEELTPSAMKTVKGIGDKKVEKFGHHFTSSAQNEKSEPSARAN